MSGIDYTPEELLAWELYVHDRTYGMDEEVSATPWGSRGERIVKPLYTGMVQIVKESDWLDEHVGVNVFAAYDAGYIDGQNNAAWDRER